MSARASSARTRSPATSAPGSVRPGGRTERNRQAVATAALALLSRGETQLSPALVAEEAGVSRSTVHRRWPTRADLLREAHDLHTRALTVPDTGSLERDLRQLARSLARFFSDPVEIAMSSAMAAHADPAFNAWVLDYWQRHAETLALPFERAAARGEIPEVEQAATLVEMLIAPMIMRTVVMKQGLPKRFVDELADAVIRAAQAPR